MQHGYGRPIRVGDPGGLHPVPARRQVNANRCSLGAPAWGVVADLVCRVDHHQPTGRDLPFQCRLPLCDRQLGIDHGEQLCRSRCWRWRSASARHRSSDPSARPGRPLCGRQSGRSRLLAQLLAAGAPGGSGAGEDAAQLRGALWPEGRAFSTCLPRPLIRAPTRPTRPGAAGRPAVPSESVPPRRTRAAAAPRRPRP